MIQQLWILLQTLNHQFLWGIIKLSFTNLSNLFSRLTYFVVFSGKDLNSFGGSKIQGSDGFQRSLLKSPFRSLRDKWKLILGTTEHCCKNEVWLSFSRSKTLKLITNTNTQRGNYVRKMVKVLKSKKKSIHNF